MPHTLEFTYCKIFIRYDSPIKTTGHVIYTVWPEVHKDDEHFGNFELGQSWDRIKYFGCLKSSKCISSMAGRLPEL